MDSNQDQGTQETGKLPANDVIESRREREQALKKNKETVNDRLDKFFQNQKAEEPQAKEQPKEGPKPQESKKPEPMPSSNQEPPKEESKEEKKAEEVKEPPKAEVPQEKPIEQPTQTQPTEVPNEEELPESASERTKRNFERMREEKRRLEEENQRLKGSVNTGFMGGQPGFVPQVPPVVPPINPNINYLPQQQVANIQTQFVQPDGSVDIDGLNKALYQANMQAAQALQQAQLAQAELQKDRAQRSRQEDARETRETYAKYPELDPDSIDFDENFRDLVSTQIVKNRMANVYKPLVDIAAEVEKRYKPVPVQQEAQSQVSEQSQRVEVQKQAQAPLEVAQGESREEYSQQEQIDRTRKGGFENQALDERLKKLGIIS